MQWQPRAAVEKVVVVVVANRVAERHQPCAFVPFRSPNSVRYAYKQCGDNGRVSWDSAQ